jgi:hypothetical protein
MQKNIRDGLKDMLDVPANILRRFKSFFGNNGNRLQWAGTCIIFIGILVCVYFQEIKHGQFGGSPIRWCAANLKRYGFSGMVLGIGIMIWLIGYFRQEEKSPAGMAIEVNSKW